MQMFLVGGAVRDELLGVSSKDLDYTVVLDESDLRMRRPANMDAPYTPVDPFEVMVFKLKHLGFNIFLETPEHLTVRAQFPKNGNVLWNGIAEDERGVAFKSLTADFVLARKESGYSDGRRPDKVEPGTLEDDIRRRDFSMNALAKDSEGNIIDLVGGVKDIEARIIRAVGDPFDRLNEDALRAVRALRFSVTKGFKIDDSLAFAMQSAAVLDKIRNNISDERISDELSKMFRFDTVASLRALEEFPALTEAMFSGRVSLDSTLKQRGRGK